MSELRSAFVIGAGTAGTKAARDLAAAGVEVTIAESGEPGGNCVWRGCVPKKALYEAAATIRGLAAASRFGLTLPRGAPLDWTRLMTWKEHVQRAYVGDQRAEFARRGIELLETGAAFASPGEIVAGGRSYHPDVVVIATGSEPVLPPIPGIGLADTSEDALSYSERPSSLAILGGGYIAMEFAAIYASFGTDVTVIVRGDRPLQRFDHEMAAQVRRGLDSIGVKFVMETAVTSIEGALGDLRVALRGPDRVGHVLRAARLLAATGRRPALTGLGLTNAGIKLDDHGAPVVDAALRTSNRRVWLAGDAVGGIELTPVANLEGERIARSLLSGREQRIDLSAMPTACFSVPEVAQVGITEEQAQARGLTYTVGRDDFRYTAQAIIGERSEGLVKIVAGQDGRVLGAAIAGAHASELIYPFALAVGTRMTAGQIASLRAIHPSYSEALNWAAGAVPEQVELEKAA